jgi:hypothetical protein
VHASQRLWNASRSTAETLFKYVSMSEGYMLQELSCVKSWIRMESGLARIVSVWKYVCIVQYELVMAHNFCACVK